MNIELTAPTKGSLHEHVSSLPSLPVCFDSSGALPLYPAKSQLDFVVGINAIAWGESDEIYPYPHMEEVLSEWAAVDHNVPAILSKWRDYGLFGTNIEGWFALDPRDTDSILRAVALFGFVLWVEQSGLPMMGEARVLCGFHRALGFNTLNPGRGIDFEHFNVLGAEVYVVIPTIFVETDHPSTQYIHYNTLETQ